MDAMQIREVGNLVVYLRKMQWLHRLCCEEAPSELSSLHDESDSCLLRLAEANGGSRQQLLLRTTGPLHMEDLLATMGCSPQPSYN